MKKTFLMTIAAAAIFTACEKDEINSLNNDLDLANGRIEQIATQANAALEEAKLELEAAIVAGDEVAEAAAAEALAAYIVSQADINDDIQAQLDALEGVSASYDAETGIVAITLANGTIFETGDLRGEDGEDGRDGRDGADGADGINGTNGTDGQDGADGADGADGIGGGGEPGLSQEAIQALIDEAIAGINHTDISDLEARIVLLEAIPVDDDSALNTLILELKAEVAQLKSDLAVLNGTDEIVFELSAAVISGGVSSTANEGSSYISGYKIGSTVYATLDAAKASVAAGVTVSIVTINAQDVKTSITAEISTVTKTYSVKVNGAVDSPALVAPAAESIESVITAASESIATNFSDGESVSYTAPVIADPADEYVPNVGNAVVSGGVLSTVNNGSAVITYHIGDVEYASLQAAKDAVAAGSTATIITRSTQATLDNTTAVLSTVITTYTIKVNGDDDGLAPKPNTVSTTETAAATSVAGTPVVSDSSESYTAPAAPAAEWSADVNGVYTHPDYSGVSFTDVALNVVIPFVAPNGIAQASLTIDGVTTSVGTADGKGTLADLIAYIETLL